MGDQNVRQDLDNAELRRFTKQLLNDLAALELMLERGMFETGVHRIGAEQELFLVDEHWQPARLALEVLEALDDPHFGPELGLFNLELNAEPVELGGDSLGRLERGIEEALKNAQQAAAGVGARLALTGILPTLSTEDLDLGSMTPEPRYRALDEALRRLRGEEYQFHIHGRDELILAHDNVMVEACNTSFQVHFQVSPEDFAARYNAAQAAAAPVLAAAVNSPLLFGKVLWRETRIALFEQSTDTRAPAPHLREQSPRVSFGEHWVSDSVTEIFQEDVARFRVLLGDTDDEDPFAKIEKGEPPELHALRLHNGTVYRWNRPCYGILDGRAHLRIENRILPAGPTLRDEIANAAFWLGLVEGICIEIGEIASHMEFSAVKENFLAAARLGLAAPINWLERDEVPAQSLIIEELLPLAHRGLRSAGLATPEINLYLGVVEKRVGERKTGAQWLIDSLDGMEERGTPGERMATLVAGAYRNRLSGQAVDQWPLAELTDTGASPGPYETVEQVMTTDLFTVNPEELVDLAAQVMRWQHLRHVPVEEADHRLVGLLTSSTISRAMDRQEEKEGDLVPVSEIMETEPITATPATRIRNAIALMRRHHIECLPIVDGHGLLVGLLTERAVAAIADEPPETIGAADEEPPDRIGP